MSDIECRFSVGAKVWWSSQAQGIEKSKQGVVHKIIKKGHRPATTRLGNQFTLMFSVDSSNTRSRDTALVVVPSGKPGVKPKLYWPLDSQLQLA